MAEALSGDDRLPWLDAPRPARPKPASRRARGPLLVLLGLFLASAIAVMAFLAGRSTAPRPGSVVTASLPPPTEAAPIPPISTPIPEPAPEIPTTPSAPVAVPPTPTAAAPIGATPVRSTPVKPRAEPVGRRSSAPRATPMPAPAVVAGRVTAPAPTPQAPLAVSQRRVTWPARPFGGPRGQVIQLGAHLTQQGADASWWRLARAYPYLTTLPRMVTWYGPSRGRPRYYRVRLAAGSNREARALCRNLVRINRACMVV